MRATADIITALVAAMNTAQWTPEGGDPEPAFAVVKPFDSTDLPAAFAELLVTEQRVALIVYTGDDFEDANSGPGQVEVRRAAQISILVSDRVLGKRQEAIFGSATHPGALRLKDIALAAVAGPLCAQPEAVDCRPVHAEPLILEDLKKKQPGRVAYLVDLECSDQVAESFPDPD